MEREVVKVPESVKEIYRFTFCIFHFLEFSKISFSLGIYKYSEYSMRAEGQVFEIVCDELH